MVKIHKKSCRRCGEEFEGYKNRVYCDDCKKEEPYLSQKVYESTKYKKNKKNILLVKPEIKNKCEYCNRIYYTYSKPHKNLCFMCKRNSKNLNLSQKNQKIV